MRDAETVLPPLQRRGTVRRVALLARLDAAPAGSLILLLAPGGYGKTTTLRQWAARTADVCAWVTAGPRDNDPRRLALQIAAALRRAVPAELPPAGLPLRAAAGHRLDPADLPAAVRALHRPGRSVVLVIDDLHELTSRASLELVRRLLDDSGTAVRVAAAGRTKPDLVVPALAATGRCLELGPADLALSEAETRQVLAAAGQVATPDVARAVVQRTEGWAAGVFLAALAARQGPPDARSPSRPGVIAGDDVFIADHFRSEVLAGEPADNVRFLLRTAVLDRMTGPLCDAVLRTTGSGGRLREALRRNLFVVPVAPREPALDRHGPWFRYHRMFREMLLAELRLREPGEERVLHRRAAAWFEAEGLPDEAIPHALAGGDQSGAARLLDRRLRQGLAEGRHPSALAWLDRLDDAALAPYPPLAVTAGWIWALGGQVIRAQSALRVARGGDPGSLMPDGSGSLESAVTLLAAFLAPLGVERMEHDARRAVELQPAVSPQRPVALALLGVAHALAGRPELAVPLLLAAAELAPAQQKRTAAFARSELALLALSEGNERADADIAASLALLEDAGPEASFEGVLVHAVAAWGAARAGDLTTMRRHLGVAQRIDEDAVPETVPWYGAHVSIVLARAALEAREPLAARARLEEARQHLGRLPDEGVLRAEVDVLADGIALLARTGAPTVPPGPAALTAAEVRVLQLLPTHLSLSEIAEELNVSRNTVKTQVAATYRKLQAATRAEAVRRGRELSLLT